MKNSNLRYFQSVELPNSEEHQKTFVQLEDILQQEHESSGRHKLASESQSGFMTPIHVQKLERMYEWFIKQQNQ